MIRVRPSALLNRGAMRSAIEPHVSSVAFRGSKPWPNSRTASVGMGNMGGLAGMGGDVSQSGGGLFYSPTLSTDFYELPRSAKEERFWYRWFEEHDPVVGRAIELHSQLPLSKVRLTIPKARDHDKAKKILHFFEKMWEDVQGFQALLDISHQWWLFGEVFPFFEYDEERKVWSRIVVLDGANVEVEPVPFSSESDVYLVPDAMEVAKAKEARDRSGYDDSTLDLLERLEQDGRLPLDTDPLSGSHVVHLRRKKAQDGSRGISILKRCLTTLLYRDKLRQAQTQISSRNMTPKHLVWAEGLNPQQIDMLRDQVDMALNENDFSIITNYEVHWTTIGANDRLLDLQTEYDMTDMRLLTGLGLTKEIVAGEGTWGSTRINLEVMNTEYLFFREIMQNLVEHHMFRPIALANGFVEKNEFGDLEVIYPRLSFTRLSIRDNEAVFNDLYNLYQKGSLPIDYILELYNIDPEDAHEKLQEDSLSFKDANFNELMRGIYMETGRKFATEPDVLMKIAESLKIKPSPMLFQPPTGEGGVSGGGGFGGGLMGDFGGGNYSDLGAGMGGEELPQEGLGGDLGQAGGPGGELPPAGEEAGGAAPGEAGPPPVAGGPAGGGPGAP